MKLTELQPESLRANLEAPGIGTLKVIWDCLGGSHEQGRLTFDGVKTPEQLQSILDRLMGNLPDRVLQFGTQTQDMLRQRVTQQGEDAAKIQRAAQETAKGQSAQGLNSAKAAEELRNIAEENGLVFPSTPKKYLATKCSAEGCGQPQFTMPELFEGVTCVNGHEGAPGIPVKLSKEPSGGISPGPKDSTSTSPPGPVPTTTPSGISASPDYSSLATVDSFKDLVKALQLMGCSDFERVKSTAKEVQDSGSCPLLVRAGDLLDDRLLSACMALKIPGTANSLVGKS